jgi:hypothetical protein
MIADDGTSADEASDDGGDEIRIETEAWQAKEKDQVESVLRGDASAGEVMGELVAEAFTGQDADRILGEAAFSAPSPSLLDQPLLVVFQPPKLIATSDTYTYALPDGTELAVGEQTNQGLGRKLLRMTSNLDSRLKTIVEVTHDGAKVFSMERKGALGKNTMVIRDSQDGVVGEVKQTKRDRRARFALVANGETLATADVGRLRPGSGFDIVDAEGAVIAFVRRLHEGAFKSMGRWAMDSPDNYVLRVAKPLEDPLRTLVVATPMSVDSAVNQDDEGLDIGKVIRRLR